MKSSNISEIPEIQEWIDIVENEPYKVSKDQKQLIKHVKKCFKKQNIYVDVEQLSKYMSSLKRYMPFDLFPWQKFVFALHLCTYWEDTGQPRWPDLVAMIGRGAGKDGSIACEAVCLTSPHNGIKHYDVDICANNEEQAKRPVFDIIEAFETNYKKVSKFYSWTKEQVCCEKTKSTIKGRTNNPKSKDGMRSGLIVFNEVHEYLDYKNIDVFTTGQGKVPHPRTAVFTTNGNVREGPLDDYIEAGEEVLTNEKSLDDSGVIYFFCRLDSDEEVHDEANWTKANPSMYYLPNLRDKIRREYKTWKDNPYRAPSFMAKRMNRPAIANDTAVADWEDIAKTNKDIPDLTGKDCTVGIDFARTTDFVSVNAHFKIENERYDINHTWVCTQSRDLPGIKAPLQKWADMGILEFVNDIEIHPDIVAAYVQEIGRKYNIKHVAIDSYRYSLMADSLTKVGISKERGNLSLIKNRDIIQIVPVIERCFRNGYFNWGDNPCLRWATNNTKLISYGKKEGADKGSFVYAKIDSKKRKTDPFMALVASMMHESEIKTRAKINRRFTTIKL